MNRKKIVTFGELLLRFSKPGQLRLTQGDLFTSKYGGSEANVAVSLATQGENVTYITRLPDTPVGHAGAMNLAELGVDTSQMIYGGQRIGTYYFEPAAGMRAAKVIYDRAGSAYFDLKPGMIPWREILKDCAYFHVSGITAAISAQAAEATFEALDIADELGVTICFQELHTLHLVLHLNLSQLVEGGLLEVATSVFRAAIVQNEHDVSLLCHVGLRNFSIHGRHLKV